MNKYKAIKVNGKKYDEHRYIMETHLGRKLSFNEVVHHKDGNKRNNNIQNLEVIERSAHSRLHRIGQKLNVSTKEKLKSVNQKNRVGAKLSIEEVKQVKILYSKGIKQSEIVKKFEVSKFVISRICTNKYTNWI